MNNVLDKILDTANLNRWARVRSAIQKGSSANNDTRSIQSIINTFVFFCLPVLLLISIVSFFVRSLLTAYVKGTIH